MPGTGGNEGGFLYLLYAYGKCRGVELLFAHRDAAPVAREMDAERAKLGPGSEYESVWMAHGTPTHLPGGNDP